jgi:lysophospholipase L1-like esterase
MHFSIERRARRGVFCWWMRRGLGHNPGFARPVPSMKFSFPVALRRLALAILCAVLPAASAWAAGSAHWVGAWAVAPQAVAQQAQAPAYDKAPLVAGRTIRQIIYPRLSGRQARIRISNTFGTQPLVISQAVIGISAGGAALQAGSGQRLTFGGKRSVTILPGAQLNSDAVPLEVTAGRPLAVSFYIQGEVAATTWHKIASQVNYVSAIGNHAEDLSGAAFTRRITSYVWLDGLDLDMDAASPAFAVVAIGDSITDGMRSSLNRNRRWPDALAARLGAGGAAADIAVLNLGISGNRLLNDSPCYGGKLVGRFERDALAQPGVRAAILLIGINDINFGAMPPHRGLDCDFPHVVVSAKDLIGGYQRLVAEAHRRGVKLFGATLTPASLPPDREAVRQEVNHWIRTGGAFDGVVDFDAALKDPAQPMRLRADFDSGDHIHPNDAGYSAMAAAVPLDGLRRAGH